MGYDNYIYIGPYIKVWPPKENRQETILTCLNESCASHGKRRSSERFCSSCGGPHGNKVVSAEHTMSMYSFMDEHLSSGDLFSLVYKDDISSKENGDFCLVLPNNKKQGGLSLGGNDYGIHSIPDMPSDQFQVGDWALLTNKLNEKQIRYLHRYGCIVYAR